MAGEKRWVSSENAKLKAEASTSSETIIELAPGLELEVLSTSGRWHEISTSSGEQGWIYRGAVSDHPPGDDELMGGEDDLFDDPGESQIQADISDTSRSIR